MAGEDEKRLEGYCRPRPRPTLGCLSTGSRSEWSPSYPPGTRPPMGAEVFAPTLGAGNAVVWNPSSSTAACSALLAEVIAGRACLLGVFNFLPGSGSVVGNAIVAHSGVDAIGFVGSVATGRKVASAGAGKTQVLSSGGNGPMVILEDADLGSRKIEATLEAAYLCAGQSCTAGERFLVHSSVRAEYVERVLATTAERVRLGDPLDPATTMGPFNNESNALKFDERVEDTHAHGATVQCGGKRAPGFPTELYAEATVLEEGVTAEMLVAHDETFGPVVPVIEVSSDKEALESPTARPSASLLRCSPRTSNVASLLPRQQHAAG